MYSAGQRGPMLLDNTEIQSAQWKAQAGLTLKLPELCALFSQIHWQSVEVLVDQSI